MQDGRTVVLLSQGELRLEPVELPFTVISSVRVVQTDLADGEGRAVGQKGIKFFQRGFWCLLKIPWMDAEGDTNFRKMLIRQGNRL